jgi:hypothetical protein
LSWAANFTPPMSITTPLSLQITVARIGREHKANDVTVQTFVKTCELSLMRSHH